MLILGLILVLIGWLTDIGILTTIGVVLLVIGAVLWILGSTGRPVAATGGSRPPLLVTGEPPRAGGTCRSCTDATGGSRPCRSRT